MIVGSMSWAPEHGCHGDSSALPRLFLTVGGKNSPASDYVGFWQLERRLK